MSGWPSVILHLIAYGVVVRGAWVEFGPLAGIAALAFFGQHFYLIMKGPS